jgi:hypothetical protein
MLLVNLSFAAVVLTPLAVALLSAAALIFLALDKRSGVK